jgi:hypothetical protein
MRFLDQYVFDTTRVLPLVSLTVIVSFIGGFVYLALAWVMGSPELEAFARIAQKLGNWRGVLNQTGESIEQPPTQAEEMKPL